MRDPENLKRDLPLAAQVFLVMEAPLTETQFRRLWRVLCEESDREHASADEDRSWLALQARAEAAGPWSRIVPPGPKRAASAEEGLRVRQAFHTLENMERVRGYTPVVIEGLRYGLDLFNPKGELGLGYPGEGEPVLLLLIESERSEPLDDRLWENRTFWRMLRRVGEILRPRHIVGTSTIASYALARNEGRVVDKSPWEFMFPLHLLKKPRHLSDRERLAIGDNSTSTNDSLLLLWPVLQDPRFHKAPMARLFGHVEVWDEDSIMVLVSKGLDGVIRPEYREAAHLLGMTSIVELIPGAYS